MLRSLKSQSMSIHSFYPDVFTLKVNYNGIAALEPLSLSSFIIWMVLRARTDKCDHRLNNICFNNLATQYRTCSCLCIWKFDRLRVFPLFYHIVCGHLMWLRLVEHSILAHTHTRMHNAKRKLELVSKCNYHLISINW